MRIKQYATREQLSSVQALAAYLTATAMNSAACVTVQVVARRPGYLTTWLLLCSAKALHHTATLRLLCCSPCWAALHVFALSNDELTGATSQRLNTNAAAHRHSAKGQKLKQ
jgi:hypothetical protein